MEQTHTLENFLSSLKTDGEELDPGSFSLKVTGMRERFAGLLENRTDWLLKVIQAAVASECESIKVRLKRGKTEVLFQAPEMWSSSLLRTELCSTLVASHPALEHLKVFFWSEACGYGNRIEFTLPEESCRLLWDGEGWVEKPLLKLTKNTGFQLTVDMELPSTLSFKGLRASARINSELQILLSTRAFSCPVPLICDGRRFDSLLHCPSHSIKDMESHPLELSAVDAEIPPSFLVPRATFENSFNFRVHGLPVKLQLFYRAWKKTLVPFRSASVVRLLCLHLKQVESGIAMGESKSCLYFIKDGVIVEARPLGPQRTTSFACFVSAEGLATDLSTLKLRQGPESEERWERARLHLSKMTWDSPRLDVLQDASRMKNGIFGLTGFASGILGQVLIEAATGFLTFGAGTVLAAIMMACIQRQWLSQDEAQEYFALAKADLEALKEQVTP